MTTRRLRGSEPVVHEDAYVAPSAILIGDVVIGARTVVLDGAVITAESAPVTIGEDVIVMEHAVLRGAGDHPSRIGDRTMIGPGTHISGATIGQECMVATHASVFNGAEIGNGCMIAIGAIVHVGTRLPDGARVPMQHIAAGDPAVVYTPDQAEFAHQVVDQIGFTRQAFGFDTSNYDFQQTLSWLTTTYSRALRHHYNKES